jgi:hypothetical protein
MWERQHPPFDLPRGVPSRPGSARRSRGDDPPTTRQNGGRAAHVRTPRSGLRHRTSRPSPLEMLLGRARWLAAGQVSKSLASSWQVPGKSLASSWQIPWQVPCGDRDGTLFWDEAHSQRWRVSSLKGVGGPSSNGSRSRAAPQVDRRGRARGIANARASRAPSQPLAQLAGSPMHSHSPLG